MNINGSFITELIIYNSGLSHIQTEEYKGHAQYKVFQQLQVSFPFHHILFAPCSVGVILYLIC